MFGTLRFILAALVALSHIDVRFSGLNPGVSAVVVFYLLTGYVMTAQLRGKFSGARNIPAFYIDRILRIFPAYLFFAGLTLLWFYLSGHTTAFLQHTPSATDLLNNLMVIPLNLYMFNQADQFTLLPAAWSLGAELQFYLLIPLLLIPGMRSLALVISLSVFLFASLGLIQTEWYGYRLLPGVLLIFLTGGYLFDSLMTQRRSGLAREQPPSTNPPRRSGLGREQPATQPKSFAGKPAPTDKPHVRNSRAHFALAATLTSLVIIALSIHFSGLWHLPYSREVFIGLALGIPTVALLARLPRQNWDEWLGHLSYGLFLAHFLWIWAAGDWLGATALHPLSVIAGSTLLAAFAILLIETPITRWRHRLRNAKQAPN